MITIDFTDKKAIVTGGCGGIGSKVVEGILLGGGTVYLIYNRNAAPANAFVEKYGKDHVIPVQVDMSKFDDIIESYGKIISEAGVVDILINIAGIISEKPFEDISLSEWEKTIAINLNSVFVSCQTVYRHMLEQGQGRIVNVSSVAGKVGGGLMGTAAYAASKSGVNAMTKAIAKEGGPKGICCNAVCPSLTRTPMTEKLSEEKWNRIISGIPLHRCAEPQEIANVILFYASDLASFCNGEITDVDGGLVLDG